MALTSTGTIQILEGVVGSLLTPGGGGTGQPQAMNGWLRAMKDDIRYMAANIEDDFVVDVVADPDDSEETVQAAATYLLGFCAHNKQAAAVVVQVWDVATPTPGTTATGQQGTLYLPSAGLTTPSVGGVVWFPYEYFGTTCLMSATLASDYATGTTTDYTNAWSVRRNE